LDAKVVFFHDLILNAEFDRLGRPE
jgi:hypothetical protein